MLAQQPSEYPCTAAAQIAWAQRLRQENAELLQQSRALHREARQLLAQAVMRHERLRADGWVGPWRRLAVTARDGGPSNDG